MNATNATNAMRKAALRAESVLEEIEFELAQGAVSRDELGQRLQAVRAFQNRQRGDLLGRKPDAADALSRQMQLNDMLLTLMQGMVAEIEAMRFTLRRHDEAAPRSTALAPSTDAVETAPQPLAQDDLPWRPTRELRDAMRPEALEMTMDVRPTGIPVIGTVAQRLRIALHDLSLFYLRRFAQKQGAVNHTFGEWFLHLNDIHQAQQAQIEALTAQVATLQAELAARRPEQ